MEERINFVIFQDPGRSTVYCRDQDFQIGPEEDLVKYISDPYKVTDHTFLTEAGTIINGKVILVDNGIPNMRFIMVARQYGFNHHNTYTYATNWNHPVLKTAPPSISNFTPWIRKAIDYLFPKFKEDFLRGGIDEETLLALKELLETADQCAEGFMEEVVIYLLAEFFKQYYKLQSTLLFKDFNDHFGLPEHLRTLCDAITRQKPDRNKMLEPEGFKREVVDLLALLKAIRQRKDFHHFNRLKEIAEALNIEEPRALITNYIWLFSEKRAKLLELLSDTRLNLDDMKRIFRRPADYYNCFISFSVKDQPFVDKLVADLQKAGIIFWYSRHDLKGGKKIHTQLKKAMQEKDKLLLVLSQHSMNSEWVKTEIANARKLERGSNREVLLPVTIVPYDEIKEWECFDADTGKDSAREIREYFIINFQEWNTPAEYQKNFNRLLDSLVKE